MSVVVAGLNHRSVPLRVLEMTAVTPEQLPKALGDLAAREYLSEVVVVSTCMRTEVYAVATRYHGGVNEIRDFLCTWSGAPIDDVAGHIYELADETAVRHLFRVASGLDSAVPGESEILRQVRDAWTVAQSERTCGPVLAGLFRRAVETGKRVRSETAIARGTTSLAQAALAIAAERLGPLGQTNALVVGAGEMGESLALALGDARTEARTEARPDRAAPDRAAPDRAAPDRAAPDRAAAPLPSGTARGALLLTNRTAERASRLAARTGGTPVAWDDRIAALAGTDVVFTSTGAPDVVLDAATLSAQRPQRDGHGPRPLLVVDLGVPRNVDPAVRDLPGVTLLDMDDISAFVEVAMEGRRAELPAAEAIVAEEVERHLAIAAEADVVPLVVALRERAEAVRTAELERYAARLGALDDRQRAAVEALTRGIVAKLVHDPTVELKARAGSVEGDRLAAALAQLFHL